MDKITAQLSNIGDDPVFGKFFTNQIRSPRIEVTEVVEFELKMQNIRNMIDDFMNKSTAGKPKQQSLTG